MVLHSNNNNEKLEGAEPSYQSVGKKYNIMT